MTAARITDAGPGVGLVAHTDWIDPHDVDLLDVAGEDGWLWERDRAGFAGRGVALRIPLPAGLAGAGAIVERALGSIATTRDVEAPGSGPVAVGALPFDSGAPSELVVPALVIGRTRDGRCWRTSIGAERGDHAGDRGDPRAQQREKAVAPTSPQDPDGFALRSPRAHQDWMALVARAVAEIGAGSFSKVVLAREIRVEANRAIHVPTVLRRLRSLYPACTVLSAPAVDEGGAPARFIAASPELLVSRIGASVRSHPLAGTIPRSGDPQSDQALADSLLGSAKDLAEHAWVVRDVEDALRPWAAALRVPSSPSIVSFRNVSHLGTVVEATLTDDPASRPSALTLAEALHPTAAVGGTPRAAALAWIAAHEGLDRGPYAGPVGWTDARGDGEWVVGIRSAVVSSNRARMFAGVGVVDGSDPASELAETQFKLQALLAAIVRP